MSIYSSTTGWDANCSVANQSPINLSQSGAKSCDQLCELVFDDAYISQANVIVSNEGLILQSQTGLGSCKFNGNSYSCNTLLLTHPSHHTIENIQADLEVVAIFNSPTAGMLCVSSLARVNPSQTSATHFFNAFIPYSNSNSEWTPISLGEQWGLFMMVPPAGSYFVYDGSMVVPPCQQTKWCVFKSMINIDSNDFAMLVKNVPNGSRPIQALGDRQIYFNDVEQLPGGPMPHDGKTYMRCKRSGRKPDVKSVQQPSLSSHKKSESSKTYKWMTEQMEWNELFELISSILMLLAGGFGLWYGWNSGPSFVEGTVKNGGWLALARFGHNLAAMLRPARTEV